MKIYTVQPSSEEPKETGAAAKLRYAASLFKKSSVDSEVPPVEGIVVIFDSADGGIIASSLSNSRQFAVGSMSQENFWKHSFMDPPEAFRSTSNPQGSPLQQK